jgi:phosphotransferase system  glucose/maltose/N-acetylglucosamine-specific IIC component
VLTADADERTLTAIKIAHTAIWAVFASAIVALPIAAGYGRHKLALGLALLVAVEVAILALNQWRCPLTPLAAKYTAARDDNFDIYLPLWLARYNKLVFGGLYVAGVVFAGWQWLRSTA